LEEKRVLRAVCRHLDVLPALRCFEQCRGHQLPRWPFLDVARLRKNEVADIGQRLERRRRLVEIDGVLDDGIGC
jgi:hypothetical protein